MVYIIGLQCQSRKFESFYLGKAHLSIFSEMFGGGGGGGGVVAWHFCLDGSYTFSPAMN